jgi:hypothetical protein
VNPKIAGKWMFIPLKMVCIGIDPYPSTTMKNTMISTLKPRVVCRFSAFSGLPAWDIPRNDLPVSSDQRIGPGAFSGGGAYFCGVTMEIYG